MKSTTGRRGNVRFWLGILLLSLTALLWIVVTIAFLCVPEGVGGDARSLLALSIIPVAVGIYWAARGSGHRFWVGVALFFLSALFWFVVMLGVLGPPARVASTVIGALLLSVTPVAIGLSFVIRARKVSGQGGMSDLGRRGTMQSASEQPEKEDESEIILTMPFWFRAIAWWGLVIGIVIFIAGLLYVGERESWLVVACICLLLPGMWMLSMTKKVILGRPPGYLTIELGSHWRWPHVVKTTRIPKREIQTVDVHERAARFSGFAEGWSSYLVKVTTRSGKELILHRDSEEKRARYLAERIARFTKEFDEA